VINYLSLCGRSHVTHNCSFWSSVGGQLCLLGESKPSNPLTNRPLEALGGGRRIGGVGKGSVLLVWRFVGLYARSEWQWLRGEWVGRICPLSAD